MKDHYKILGVSKEASSEEVKKAYFALAKKYHPDASDKAELEKFHAITKAYKTLSDKEKRKEYDLTLGGGKIEKIVIDEVPPHPTIHIRPEKKDTTERQKEIADFRRGIFWQAVFKTVGFSLIAGVVGGIVSFILAEIWWGILAGVFAGFPWSVSQNFDLSSFVESAKRRKNFRIAGWGMFVLGIGYFLGLIIYLFI